MNLQVNKSFGAESEVNLIAVGDISLETKDNARPFDKVKEALSNKDILFGNLETVLSNRGEKAEKAVLLYTLPEKVEYLKDAGFDVLNLANNHIMDMGIEGFNDTLEVLNQNGLATIGVKNKKFNQSYTIIERKGIKLGFLGYYEHGFENCRNGIFINGIDEDSIVTDIKNLKLKSDIVVVSLHWGIENVFYPSPAQIKCARTLIDAGAALVLGHHPHVVQGIERYKNGLVAYSLGNFQFDCKLVGEINEKASDSLILSVDISRDGAGNYEIIPVKIKDNFAPYILSKEEKEENAQFFYELSRPIMEGAITKSRWFEQIARDHLVGNLKAWSLRIRKYGIKHLLQCIRWHMSPFTVKCYLGLFRKWLRKKEI